MCQKCHWISCIVVHLNLVIVYYVHASDDQLLMTRIDHHNQQLFDRLIYYLRLSVHY